MEYLVSLLTRPLSYATLFQPIASLSDGKSHLRHWGILVSDMSLLDLEVLLSRTRRSGTNDRTVLGTMYELYRIADKNSVKIDAEFEMDSLKTDWPMFVVTYVGKTTMSYKEIKGKGIDAGQMDC
jgi:hypothetical protein